MNQQFKSKKSDFYLKISNKKFKELLLELEEITSKYMLPSSPYDRSTYTPYNQEVSKKYSLLNYINASVVDQFIAMQMPKDIFVGDFLNFLQKSNCKFIVSLIDCKGLDYFSEGYLFQRIPYFLDKKLIFYDETYKLNLQYIRRLRYLHWKDFCAPEKEDFQAFIQYFLDLKCEDKIFVHCMCGFGRTGTFIMYNFLLNLKPVNDEKFLEVLLKLRTKRCNLVETEEQLQFLYEIFVD